jgi:hypothetical protein
MNENNNIFMKKKWKRFAEVLFVLGKVLIAGLIFGLAARSFVSEKLAPMAIEIAITYIGGAAIITVLGIFFWRKIYWFLLYKLDSVFRAGDEDSEDA